MVNTFFNKVKKDYKEHKSLVVFSFLPFIMWLSIGLSDNFEISGVIEFCLCFISFGVLSLTTPINIKKIKVISIVCLAIISYLLFVEGQSNDMFGLLYPYFISVFCLYYLFLNMISIVKR